MATTPSTSSQLNPIPSAVPAIPASRIRWRIVCLVALVTGLTYFDRLNLGIVAKNIQEQFKFSADSMGWVLGAFSLGYALFHIPAGWLADRFGARRVLAVAVGWFSIFTALTAFAPRLPLLSGFGAAWAFVLVRFLMGAGESAAMPVGNKLMGNWLGPDERALGTSIFLTGVGVAGIAAPVLITRAAIEFGWQTTFVALGAVGALVAVASYWYVTDRPGDNPRVNASELALIAGGAVRSEAKRSGQGLRKRKPFAWRKALSSPSMWALMFSHFCLVYPLYIFFTWFYIYLVKVRGITVSKASFWGSAPFVANVILVPFWGWLSDRTAHALGKTWGRRVTVWIGVAGSATLLWSGSHTASNAVALSELALAAGLNFAASAILYTACTDISTKSGGSVTGLMATFGSLGGWASPVVTGAIATKLGWNYALDFATLVTIASGLAWFFIDAGRTIDA